MELLDVQTLEGPNYWSNYWHKLIVMKLNIHDLENNPTNKIDGFYERLKELIPSLQSHHCSEHVEGGFFKRVKEGTWAGHVVEHVALELQSLAGMDCGYGRTRTAEKKGIYFVVFAYEFKRAGWFAGKAAIRIVEKLIANEPVNLEEYLPLLRKIKFRESLGPSTLSIIHEAVKREIPFSRLNDSSLIVFGQGISQKKIRATTTCLTSIIGVDSACDKNETKNLLARHFIPVPDGEVVSSKEELIEVLENMQFPVAIKPINGNHGNGVTTNVKTLENALKAFELANTISPDVIVEKYIVGKDYRLLVINFKLVAAAKRVPPVIVGNGVSSIKELIDEVNKDKRRGEDHENVMSKIKVDKATESILADNHYTLGTVLPKGVELYLKTTANISSGGSARDVTDIVHPANVLLAERIARIMDLDICGIDVIAEDIAKPIDELNGGVIEVNASPGFRMHLQPSKGLPRNVAAPVMKMLYPDDSSARIPVVAVTGTNGKTTTTRLVAHLAKTAGHKVGFTTTDGIYIQDRCVHYGDCTGFRSTEAVLHDPTIDFAVLECARGGILRSGLGFDYCNISIITNVSEDHLGLKDIDTLNDMARVKSVVAKSTFRDGYAILNADDDLVYEMKDDVDCKVGLFSTEATNARVLEHCSKGGRAAIIEKGYLVICDGEWKHRICKVADIPLSFSGKASCMIKNLLPAALSGFILNFKMDDIRRALLSFIPSPEFTPGRMNLFNVGDISIMIDYAHNPGGFNEMKQFLDQSDFTRKIGIITGVGDRRDEDIIRVGSIAAQIFDEIIIRHDEDLRGRTAESIDSLLMDGIRSAGLNIPTKIIPLEAKALEYAMEHAGRGSVIIMCCENVRRAIDMVKALQENEKKQTTLQDAK